MARGRNVWQSTKLTLLEKIMHALGWVRRDITRELTCAWCGKTWEWSGEATSGVPTFCSTTHKYAAHEARRKRREAGELLRQRTLEKAKRRAQPEPQPEPVAEPEPAPVSEPEPAPKVCTCRNHMGSAKQRYPSPHAAIHQVMVRHLRYGKHGIYKCPDTECWHITSRPREAVA